MEDIVLTPYAPNLVESTRSIGYSFETALADIIDNSISNNAKKIDIQFKSHGSPYIAIMDNGNGMNKSSLEQAMRYGSSNSLEDREEQDLGRFGLGLKMASLSQCRRLTVISKHSGCTNAVSWDLDYIYKTKNWSLISYSEEETKTILFYDYLEKNESGTVIIWENLDRISESNKDFEKEFNSRLSFADRHIALVFHRFLEARLNKNYIEIFFNKRKIEPIDP
ncbi:ATP-binding protein, partial [Listeria monocytogenes]|nr:ATP-binding protein [Listeria monocytogenes]